jgi:acetyl-CoA carboxylase biotin carboxyl carrier protein
LKKKTKLPASQSPKTAAKTQATRSVVSKGVSSPMDLDMLGELVKLMSANDLNTVDLRDGDKRVVLKRGAELVQAYAPAPAMPQPVVQTPAAASPAPAAVAVSDDAGLVAIKSPMVGTFYARPNPDAKNFVSVGSIVNEDSDVCIIEAMKVFNNIKAETKGTIAKVVAEDGKPVEFGQVLFLVKPM